MVLGLSKGFVSSGVSCCRVVVNQGHEVSFLHFKRGRYGYLSDELRRWEDNHVPVVFLALFDIQRSRQDIWARVRFTRDVMNLEVVFLQVGVPSCCPPVQVLWRFPVLQIRMVSEDDKREFSPSQVVSPMCERFHHG